jgi:hypothetical protein
MPSPPKPWEVNSGTAVAATPVVSQQAATATVNSMTDRTASSVPTVPNRPSTVMNNTTTTGGLGSNYGGGKAYIIHIICLIVLIKKK